MKKTIMAQDQVFWYLDRPDTSCLRTSLEADVVVIGGGMAGLTTAQAFAAKGKKVVLLEAFYCGAGASGKSSGFVTPNCEVSLSEFIDRYGEQGGKNIWQVIVAGMEHIRSTIHTHTIACNYTEQDSLLVANTQRTLSVLQKEEEQLQKLFNQSGFMPKDQLKNLLGSSSYHGAIVYKNTFGMDAYAYCQALKNIIRAQGVQVFEDTPALSCGNHTVTTLHGTVKAEHIIVCTDRFTPEFNKLTHAIYHVQNFLMISQPLTENEIKLLFPDRKLMVWDTQLIYNYFRMSGNRLLLGGGSLLSFYNRHETHNSHFMYHKLTTYFKTYFPDLELQFEHMWPGMIGVSQDVAPVSGFDKEDKSVYYIAAAGGLPVAAGLGLYAADKIIEGRDDLQDYLSPYRKPVIPLWSQKILGTKFSFALANFMSVDSQ